MNIIFRVWLYSIFNKKRAFYSSSVCRMDEPNQLLIIQLYYYYYYYYVYIEKLIKHADPIRYYFYSLPTQPWRIQWPFCSKYHMRVPDTRKEEEERKQQTNLCMRAPRYRPPFHEHAAYSPTLFFFFLSNDGVWFTGLVLLWLLCFLVCLLLCSLEHDQKEKKEIEIHLFAWR
jgi:hypothetical protein